MLLTVRLERWHLGLHGLALLRSYPYGDPEQAEARMSAMRSILSGEVEMPTLEIQAFEGSDTDRAYELWCARYDEPNPLIVAEERALLAMLDEIPPGSAIDVACGTGRVAAHLLRRGHRVIACDRSAAMLERASANLEGVSVVQSDLRALPIRPESADLVTCSLALTHVADLGMAFRSFAQVLRPAARAVISDIHPFAVMTGAHAFFRKQDDSRAVAFNEQHWFSEYVRSAIGAGFSIERCEEAFIDEALLREFGGKEHWLDPERAVLGLPFGLMWVLRRNG
jgi:ubiquinone/menaquinone biosynthesis C-methylase UbiE